MNNVRFTRVLCVFSILTSTSGLALAQEAPADPLAALPTHSDQADQASSPLTQAEAPMTDPTSGVGVAPVDSATASQFGNAGQIQQARTEMAEQFGVSELAPGEFHWASDIPRRGATKVVISLTYQLVFVYRDDRMIGVSTISSGKTDHETPTGTFPILGKERVHHSKTYDNAAMPYMQRLNGYGVALHGGNNPGYPASHGCIRLPMKFAAKLFDLTQPGTPVIIET